MSDDELAPLGSRLDRRKLILGALLTASAGLTFARQPHQRIDYLGSTTLEKLIPKRIGGWQFLTNSGLVVPSEDPLSNSLYAQLLTRVYTDDVAPAIMLLIAQSAEQTGLLQVHRPEFCYPAGGYSLSPIVPRPIRGHETNFVVNQLTATIPGRTEQILYWTRVGDSMPSTWSRQRLTIAKDNLNGIIPDAVLVRISTIDTDADGAFTRLSGFIDQLIAAIPAGKQKFLIGSS